MAKGTYLNPALALENGVPLVNTTRLLFGAGLDASDAKLELVNEGNDAISVAAEINVVQDGATDRRMSINNAEQTKSNDAGTVTEIIPTRSLRFDCPLAGDGAQFFEAVDVYGDLQVGNADDPSLVHLVGRDSDPSSPPDGSMWYRSDLGEYRGVENGTKVSFDTTTV